MDRQITIILKNERDFEVEMLSEKGILYRGEPEGEQRLQIYLGKRDKDETMIKRKKKKGFELFRISLKDWVTHRMRSRKRLKMTNILSLIEHYNNINRIAYLIKIYETVT